MTWFGRKRELLWIFLAVALSNCVAPGYSSADDDGRANSPVKAPPESSCARPCRIGSLLPPWKR